MSIFDNLGGNLMSLTDALGAFTDVNPAKATSKSNADYSSLGSANLLQRGINNLEPNPRPGQYAVTPSKATTTVDPEELRQEWINRLDNYTRIANKTGVKLK